MNEPRLIYAAFALILAALLFGYVFDRDIGDAWGISIILIAIVLAAYALVNGVMWIRYHNARIALLSPEIRLMDTAAKMSPAQLSYVVGGTLVLTPMGEQPFYIEIGAERISADWVDGFMRKCLVQYQATKELPSVRDYPNDGTDQRYAQLIIDLLASQGKALKRRGAAGIVDQRE